MNTETTQEKKDRLNQMEIQLRLAGQKLDSLWAQARTATGRSRADIHQQIGLLREKLRADRAEQEALKKGEELLHQSEN